MNDEINREVANKTVALVFRASKLMIILVRRSRQSGVARATCPG